MKRYSSIIFLLTVLFLGVSLQAMQDYGPKYFAPGKEVVTAHVNWAKPYYKGPIKVLFITYRQGMREIIEIAERLDIDYQVFALQKPGLIALTKTPINVKGAGTNDELARLKQKLSGNYDLIVLGNINWDILPSSARYEILKKVKAGTGLLGAISPSNEKYLKKIFSECKSEVDFSSVLSQFPYKNLSCYYPRNTLKEFYKSILDFYKFGKGRLIFLKGFNIAARQMLTPAPQGDPLEIKMLEYDYCLNLVGQLMLWCARKESEIKIKAAAVSKNYAEPITLDYEISGASGSKLTLCLTVRDLYNKIFKKESKPFNAANSAKKVSFDAGMLPAGSYYADLQVKKDGKILNYVSIPVTVRSSSFVEDIKLNSESFRKNEQVAGTVKLANPAAGMELNIRQFDKFNRLVAAKNIPVNGPEQRFTLPRTEPLSIYQYLQVNLKKDGKTLNSRRKAFTISNLYPPENKVRTYLFEHPIGASYLEFRLFEAIAKMGFEEITYAAIYDRNSRFGKVLAWENLYSVPEMYNTNTSQFAQMGHGGNMVDGKYGPVRKPCLSDSGPRQNFKDLFALMVRKCKNYSTSSYNMGDECAFILHRFSEPDACFSKSCVKDFQAFVKDEYKSIDKLNKCYQSNYSNWGEVLPGKYKQAKKDKKSIPAWIDHRCHMEKVYAGIYALGNKEIKKLVPEAKVGYEGSGGVTDPFSAENHFLLAQSMSLNAPYPDRTFLNMVRDFSKPGTVIGGGIIGAYPDLARCGRNPAYMEYFPWLTIFEGANSLWAYEGTGGRYGGIYAVIAPDFSPYDYFKNFINAAHQIKSGPGKLLLSAKRKNDGIAILYSPSSTHLASVTEAFPSMRTVLKNLPALFRDSGFQFKYLATEEIEAGKLTTKNFRLLYMPYAQCVSPKEAAEIKKFVKNGGNVIADLRPAVADQHGHPYAQSPLDKVFGVRQNTRTARAVKNRIVVKTPVGGFKKSLLSTQSDSSIRLNSGKALAYCSTIPAVITNRYGKGKAVLLNFSVANYGQVNDRFGSGRIRKLMKSLLASLAIKPEITFKKAPLGMNAYRFNNGSTQHVGLLMDLPAFISGVNISDQAIDEAPPEKTFTQQVNFKKKFHVYDSLNGKYLGFTDSISRKIIAGKAQLLALMPYKVSKLSVSASEIETGNRLPVHIKIITESSAKADLHVFRLTFKNPDGNIVKYYTENVVAPAGKFDDHVQLSMNEKPGKWTLTAKDISTGVEGQYQFEVSDKK